MRMARRIVSAGFLALALVVCGEGTTEPGALTITVNGPPPTLTNNASLTITGTVVRTPAAPGQHLVVSITGAATNPAPDTAAADGSFSLTIVLTANAPNNLSVSATDQSGSTATPVTLTILHDNEGPRVLQVQPATATDGVTSGVIQVTLNEKVSELVGAGIAVARQGLPVAGTVVLSADSLSLTFTASSPLAENAVHQVTVGNFNDAIGNLGTGATSCFITAGTPTLFSDPASDAVFVAGSPGATLAAPDLTEIRVERAGGDLLWVIRFTAPKSLDINSPNNFLAWLDLDIDEDNGTGFITVKDTLLGTLLPASGARVEYAIALGSVPNPTVPSVAGILTDWGIISDADFFEFIPDLCGAFVGFSVPLAELGGDDGDFRVVAFLQSGDANGLRADAAPDGGFYGVSLPGPLVARSAGLGASPSRDARRSIGRGMWRVSER